MNIKGGREKAVCLSFLAEYNSRHGTAYQIEAERPEDKYPDVKDETTDRGTSFALEQRATARSPSR